MTAETDRHEEEALRANSPDNSHESTVSDSSSENDNKPVTRLIGSQRNPEAYKPKPTIAVVGEGMAPPVEQKTVTYPPEGDELTEPPKRKNVVEIPEGVQDDEFPTQLSEEGEKSIRDVTVRSYDRVELPKCRPGKLSEDLEDEFNAVFSGMSLDAMIDQSATTADQETLEPDTKVQAKVLSVQGESVFLDLGVREQGVVPLKMFPADAEPVKGQTIEVTVGRFLADEGLYESQVPLAAADVRDWSQVQVGMIVEAKITKTNSGGLECEVNRLRGFIPISQIELFRVENIEPYVGTKMTCVVEEVNMERRNLVLSRRSMLQRERDEQKAQLLQELEVGQVREGLVRKLIDGGAFVDLGGVDGFIPISKMSWGRINHPSDVLTEGTRVKVRIDRIDEETHRISLVYRDDASNPWSNIAERFEEKSTARGKVTKIMDFGAFVELMPGVEGLIHISELSHKRVANVREVVKEGDWVDVLIVSIDPQTKRIALSIKQALPEPEPEVVEPSDDESKEPENANDKKKKLDGVPAPIKIKAVNKGPLKGGTDSSGGGEKFGLKW